MPLLGACTADRPRRLDGQGREGRCWRCAAGGQPTRTEQWSAKQRGARRVPPCRCGPLPPACAHPVEELKLGIVRRRRWRLPVGYDAGSTHEIASRESRAPTCANAPPSTPDPTGLLLMLISAARGATAAAHRRQKGEQEHQQRRAATTPPASHLKVALALLQQTHGAGCTVNRPWMAPLVVSTAPAGNHLEPAMAMAAMRSTV